MFNAIPQRDESVETNVVQLIGPGFWLVQWRALHPERGQEEGVMLVSHVTQHTEVDVRNEAAEVLWSEGYAANYQFRMRYIYKGETF